MKIFNKKLKTENASIKQTYNEYKKKLKKQEETFEFQKKQCLEHQLSCKSEAKKCKLS